MNLDLPPALTLAWRELRGILPGKAGGGKAGGRLHGLGIVLACLALGVAVIAGVGTLREATDRGIAQDGRRILGGDLEIDGGSQPLPAALRDWLATRGARLSDVVRMRSMLIKPGLIKPGADTAGSDRLLVELKAVDPAWPMVGDATLEPAGLVADALANHGMLAERMVLDRLGLKPGDTVRLGNASFTLRGELLVEPDRIATPSILGPRVLIGIDALPDTGLIVPGAMVQHAMRALAPTGTDPAAFAAAVRAEFVTQGWRIRDPGNAAPGVGRFIDQTGQFMTLVGLTSLLVGGIGVANGVRAWLEARAASIAILRCLGASARTIFAVYLLQVLALSLLGIAIGLAAGVLLPMLVGPLLQDVLPVPPVAGLYPAPLALAALFGLLTALTFSLPPLGRAMRIPGASLFRDPLGPVETGVPREILAASSAVGATLTALAIVSSTDPKLSAWFCAGALATLGLFRLGGWALMATARAAPRSRRPWLRLGIANLHRPGAPTRLMLVSVGLGLSTLSAVTLTQGNISREILDQIPANAPSFFFIDIQKDQLPRFNALLAAQPGVAPAQTVPNLRARMVAVKGIPVDQLQVSPESQWALRGDRGLTYAAAMPEGTHLAAGAWWPENYTGKPLISFDAALAKGWGIGIGDVIRVNVLGRDIDLTVANLRDIAWRSLSINFAMVASPGFLEGAPHSFIATARVPPAGQAPLLRAVTDALPNVTGIRVEDVLAAVSALMDRIATALTATGSLTLLSGALVLVGTVAAGQRRRMRDAVILKTLGASHSQIRAAWLVEFGIIGLTAGLIAALVGAAASYAVVRFVMNTGWVFLPVPLGLMLFLCVLAMLMVGCLGTEAALRAKPASWLRNE